MSNGTLLFIALKNFHGSSNIHSRIRPVNHVDINLLAFKALQAFSQHAFNDFGLIGHVDSFAGMPVNSAFGNDDGVFGEEFSEALFGETEAVDGGGVVEIDAKIPGFFEEVLGLGLG